MTNELQASKDAFFELCKLYSQFGVTAAEEAQALMNNRVDDAMEFRKKYYKLFDMIGEQLKVLGDAIDAQGGPPVLCPPEESPRKIGDTEQMRMVAEAVDNALPDGYGFLVFISPFDGMVDKPRLSYASNTTRYDAIKLTKEWLFNQGEEDSWMQHIK